MFGFLKTKSKEVSLKLASVGSSLKGVVSPVSGFIKEINEYTNALNSYDYNTFTDEQVDLILANPHVKSKLALKLNKALAYNGDFDYNGVKKSVSKAIDAFMIDFKWRDFARQIMYSRCYGKAVIRVYWDDYGNITKTTGLNHKLFTYNNDVTKGDIGDLMYNMINLTKTYPYNFIVIYNEPDAKYPFGKSDLKELYPTIMFYNFLSKVEARYFNKAVIPSFVAGYESTKTGQDAIDEAEMVGNALSQIENGAGVGIANLKTLYTLMENGQVNFNSTKERLENTIAISILGSDLTDSKKNGTYAQAKVGDGYIDGNVKDLAIEIQDNSNLLINWQTWAWFGQEYLAPRWIYDMQEPYSQEIFNFMALNGYAIAKKDASKVYPIPQSVLDMPGDIWIPTMLKVEEPKKDTTDDKSDNEDSSDSDKIEDSEDDK